MIHIRRLCLLPVVITPFTSFVSVINEQSLRVMSLPRLLYLPDPSSIIRSSRSRHHSRCCMDCPDVPQPQAVSDASQHNPVYLFRFMLTQVLAQWKTFSLAITGSSRHHQVAQKSASQQVLHGLFGCSTVASFICCQSAQPYLRRPIPGRNSELSEQ